MEAGCKPVWAQCPSQVRVLPLPQSKTRRRHSCAAVAQLVGHRPFKPACVGSSPTGGNNLRRGSEALTAKHSALTRANGVRLPADPRDPGSANGRPLRFERRNRGSSPRPGTAALFDNRIVDDARGRAPPRPQQCPCSRSGDGACLKRRRRWFDSRRGHHGGRSVVALHVAL